MKYLLLALLPVWLGCCLNSDFVQECTRNCDRTSTDFGQFQRCLDDCNDRAANGDAQHDSKILQLQAVDPYPSAPYNAEVIFNVIRDRDHIFIQTTVKWEAKPDKFRTGFFVSMRAEPGSRCERYFTGYYNEMPASQNSLVIPIRTSDPSLVVLHSCEYSMQLHSTPYPYQHPNFTTVVNTTVPDCVDGFCNCKTQPAVPSVTELGIRVQHLDDQLLPLMSWKYKYPGDIQYAKSIAFFIKMADHKPNRLVNNMFKYRPNVYMQPAEKNRDYYEFALEEPLKPGMEHRIEVVAMNEHYCKSDTVLVQFTAPKPVETSTLATTISTISNSTTTLPTSASEAETSTVQSGILPIAEGSSQTGHAAKTRPPNEPTPITSDQPTSAATDVASPTISLYSYGLFILIPLAAALCLLIVICALLAKMYASKKDKQLMSKPMYADRHQMTPWSPPLTSSCYGQVTQSMQVNVLYTDTEIAESQAMGLTDFMEISYERLKLGRVIGQGAFGRVYLGTGDGIAGISGPTTVAIKQLKANATDYEQREFLEEIDCMKRVGAHANIVSMFGCVTLTHPLCMVMEYVPYGDLKHYLHNLRKQYEAVVDEYRSSVEHDYIMNLVLPPPEPGSRSRSPPASMSASVTSRGSVSIADDVPFADEFLQEDFADLNDLTYSLDPTELQWFAIQIAAGMSHIERAGVTHRDLAARNILVGHGKILKISDFGLSRHGVYVKTTKGVIPLRWLSIEAMRDHIYSTKSDVWAYGVVLWEICTLGGFPYPTVSDKHLLAFLESNGRLDKPASCTQPVYELMQRCWAYNPNHRPSFSHIQAKLTEMSKQPSPYVHFDPSTTRQRSKSLQSNT